MTHILHFPAFYPRQSNSWTISRSIWRRCRYYDRIIFGPHGHRSLTCLGTISLAVMVGVVGLATATLYTMLLVPNTADQSIIFALIVIAGGVSMVYAHRFGCASCWSKDRPSIGMMLLIVAGGMIFFIGDWRICLADPWFIGLPISAVGLLAVYRALSVRAIFGYVAPE